MNSPKFTPHINFLHCLKTIISHDLCLFLDIRERLLNTDNEIICLNLTLDVIFEILKKRAYALIIPSE